MADEFNSPPRRARFAVKTGLACALACLTFFVGWWVVSWLVSAPRYRFDFSQARDYADVVSLAELVEQLDAARSWPLPALEPEELAALVVWIKDPANAQATSNNDLLRVEAEAAAVAVSAAATQSEETRQQREQESRGLARLNGLVWQLPELDAPTLATLRTLPDAELQADLRRRLEPVQNARRERACRRMADEQSRLALLNRLKFPLPKEPASNSGEQLVWLPWAEQLVKSYQSDFAPRVQRYRQVVETQSLPLSENFSSSLFLERNESDETAPPPLLTEDLPPVDWKLALRLRDGEGEQAVWRRLDTGIHWYGMGWNTPPKNSRAVRPQWPPPSGASRVNLEELENCLQRFGLPRAWHVAQVTVTHLGDWKSPKVALHCSFRSDEDATWRAETDLRLSPDLAATDLSGALAPAITEARAVLRGRLAKSTEIAGIPVRFSNAKDKAALHATFSPADAPTLQLQADLDSDGRLIWSPLPPLADRLAWTTFLIEREPKFAAQRERLRMTEVRVDAQAEELFFRWTFVPTPSQKPARSIELTWSRGQTRVSAGSDEPVIVASKPGTPTPQPQPPKTPLEPEPPPEPAPSTVTSSGSAPLDPADVEREAREAIARQFPKVASQTSFVAEKVGDETLLRAGLQIADWPQVELGPVKITSLDAVSFRAASLLSESVVREAADRQWAADQKQTPLRHLRLGNVHGQLAVWNPEQGAAEIDCQLPTKNSLYNLLNLNWRESVRIEKGEWTGMLTDGLGAFLGSKCNFKFNKLDSRLPDWLRGTVANVRPQLDAPAGWLQVNPLRVSLVGDLAIPELLTVGAEFTVDENAGWQLDGLRLAKTLTIPTPYFNISDPEIRLSMSKPPRLEIAGRFTPPGGLPAIPLVDQLAFRPDNPWLHVAALRARFGVALNFRAASADAALEVLGMHDLASGRITLDLDAQSLAGHMSGDLPIPVISKTIPLRPEGKFAYLHRRGELSFETSLSSRGSNRGKLLVLVKTAPSGPQAPASEDERVLLTGDIQAPALDINLRAKGHSDIQFTRYDLTAGGAAGPWRVEMHARPKRVDFRYFWQDNFRFPWEYSAPSLAAVDDQGMKAELDRLRARLSAAQAKIPATKPDEAKRVLSWFPTLRWRPSGSPPPDPASEGTNEPYVELKAAELLLEPSESNLTIKRLLFDGQTVALATVPKSSLSLTGLKTDQCASKGWRRADDEGRGAEILFFVPTANPRAYWIRIPRAGDPAEVLDISEHFAPLRGVAPLALLYSSATTAQELAAADMLQTVVAEWVKRRLFDSLPESELRLRATVGGVELVSPDVAAGEPRQVARYFRVCTPRYHRFVCDASRYSPDHRDLAYQRAALHSNTPRAGWLLACEGERVCAAWREPSGQWRLNVLGDTRWPAIDVEFVPSGVRFERSAMQLGESLLTQAEPIAARRALLGNQGAALISDERLFLCRAHDSAHRLYQVEREQFVSWPVTNGSDELLCKAWQSASLRRDVSFLDAARTAVEDWEQIRASDAGWGANPLGLLIGLAEHSPPGNSLPQRGRP